MRGCDWESSFFMPLASWPCLASDAFSPYTGAYKTRHSMSTLCMQGKPRLLTSLYLCRYILRGSTYSSKPSALMAHRRSSPLIVLRFSLEHLSLALHERKPLDTLCAHALEANDTTNITYSLVIKLMNSDTHSCTVSLASFAILAFGGRAFFMIRLMFAIGRNLSCSRTLPPRSSPESSAGAELMVCCCQDLRC